MDNKTLSDLIGGIYDCALDPARWNDIIGRMASAVEASAGMVALHDLQENRGVRTFSSGMPAPIIQLYASRFTSINPIAKVAATRNEGDVDTLATMFHDDSWDRSPLNRYMLRPLGLRDILGMAVLRTSRRGVWLGTFRRDHAGAFGPREVEFFRLLAPHVIRSMRISDILDMQAVASERMVRIIDGLTTAVFLLDQQGRVAHHNAAAQALLEQSSVLRLAQGRLAASAPAAREALTRALEKAAGAEGGEATMPRSVPLGDGLLGDAAIGTVLPLGAAGSAEGRVALFVQRVGVSLHVPVEAFGALYGLTPAECRLLDALVSGQSMAEAAQAARIADATAKSHLKSMFRKTGVRRQSELIRSVMASAAPLRP